MEQTASVSMTRLPNNCPVVHNQTFPTIPPAPFHLTDDLFTALNLRPLFFQYVGKPEETVTVSKVEEGVAKTEARGSRDGSTSAGPSTPIRTGFGDQIKPEVVKVTKREWIKPPRLYDSILGGLPGEIKSETS
jgi:hypothetical protein